MDLENGLICQAHKILPRFNFLEHVVVEVCDDCRFKRMVPKPSIARKNTPPGEIRAHRDQKRCFTWLQVLAILHVKSSEKTCMQVNLMILGEWPLSLMRDDYLLLQLQCQTVRKLGQAKEPASHTTSSALEPNRHRFTAAWSTISSHFSSAFTHWVAIVSCVTVSQGSHGLI